jgi:hypothetical protein
VLLWSISSSVCNVSAFWRVPGSRLAAGSAAACAANRRGNRTALSAGLATAFVPHQLSSDRHEAACRLPVTAGCGSDRMTLLQDFAHGRPAATSRRRRSGGVHAQHGSLTVKEQELGWLDEQPNSRGGWG